MAFFLVGYGGAQLEMLALRDEKGEHQVRGMLLGALFRLLNDPSENCLFWREGGASDYPWVHSPWPVVVGEASFQLLPCKTKQKQQKRCVLEFLCSNVSLKEPWKKGCLLLQEINAEKF